MTDLLSAIFSKMAEQNAINLLNKIPYLEAVQKVFLETLLLYYQNTELGQKYRLKEIKTIDEFRERIPISNYSSYEPYIKRIAKGEINILTPERAAYINITSGTTGQVKKIPVTKLFHNNLQLNTLTALGFLSKGLHRRGLNFGKVLITNGTNKLTKTEAGIESGWSGSNLLRNLNSSYKNFLANPYEGLDIEDNFARNYICLLFALKNPDMKGFSGNFPLFVLRLCEILEEYAESFIEDIERGKINQDLELEPGVRGRLEKLLKPSRSCSDRLRKILKTEGKLTPKLAWEKLSFVITARGGCSDFYLARFPEYFEDLPIFGGVYSSAEGFWSIYPELDEEGSILAITSNFFEFIPREEWEKENPKTLLACEVKVREFYRVVTTNYNGFYRYDIGDVVEVVGFWEQTPLIVFRYRQGEFLSSSSEKTTEAHAILTMGRVTQEFGLVLKDFCITLSADKVPPNYLVNIELAGGDRLNNPESFLRNFDEKLKRINIYYGVKRSLEVIPPPRLRIWESGSFDLIYRRQVERGIPEFKLKFPHISEDRNFWAGLTVLKEVRLPEDNKG